mmetsp:Transcript_92744/g.113588  ORF Transcript_92744/g.113588 Transcript_92744/m.113588 type:complete len:345 (-) Transcript_92744:380-1414(-)
MTSNASKVSQFINNVLNNNDGYPPATHKLMDYDDTILNDNIFNEIDSMFDGLESELNNEQKNANNIRMMSHQDLNDNNNDINIDFEFDMDWNVLDNKHSLDNIGNNKRKRKRKRYFEDNTGNGNESENEIKLNNHNIGFKCFNCGSVGHIAKNCNKSKLKICFKCGESGHTGYECINDPCGICFKYGHKSYECTQLNAQFQDIIHNNKDIFCFRCGTTKHSTNNCYIDIKKRNKKLRCYICGNMGHVCCQKNDGYKRSRICCSQCGKDGHSVYVCKNKRMDISDIAKGLTTNKYEPNEICYVCLTPDHISRRCPISTRLKSKLHYFAPNNYNRRIISSKKQRIT